MSTFLLCIPKRQPTFRTTHISHSDTMLIYAKYGTGLHTLKTVAFPNATRMVHVDILDSGELYGIEAESSEADSGLAYPRSCIPHDALQSDATVRIDVTRSMSARHAINEDRALLSLDASPEGSVSAWLSVGESTVVKVDSQGVLVAIMTWGYLRHR